MYATPSHSSNMPHDKHVHMHTHTKQHHPISMHSDTHCHRRRPSLIIERRASFSFLPCDSIFNLPSPSVDTDEDYAHLDLHDSYGIIKPCASTTNANKTSRRCSLGISVEELCELTGDVFDPNDTPSCMDDNGKGKPIKRGSLDLIFSDPDDSNSTLEAIYIICSKESSCMPKKLQMVRRTSMSLSLPLPFPLYPLLQVSNHDEEPDGSSLLEAISPLDPSLLPCYSPNFANHHQQQQSLIQCMNSSSESRSKVTHVKEYMQGMKRRKLHLQNFAEKQRDVSHSYAGTNQGCEENEAIVESPDVNSLCFEQTRVHELHANFFSTGAFR